MSILKVDISQTPFSNTFITQNPGSQVIVLTTRDKKPEPLSRPGAGNNTRPYTKQYKNNYDQIIKEYGLLIPMLDEKNTTITIENHIKQSLELYNITDPHHKSVIKNFLGDDNYKLHYLSIIANTLDNKDILKQCTSIRAQRLYYTLETYMIEQYNNKSSKEDLNQYQEETKNLIKSYIYAAKKLQYQLSNKKYIQEVKKEFVPYCIRHLDQKIQKIDLTILKHEDMIDLLCGLLMNYLKNNKALREDFLHFHRESELSASNSQRFKKIKQELQQTLKKQDKKNQKNTGGESTTKGKEQKIVPENFLRFFEKIKTYTNEGIYNYCIRTYIKGKGINFDYIQSQTNINGQDLYELQKEAKKIKLDIYMPTEKTITNNSNNNQENEGGMSGNNDKGNSNNNGNNIGAERSHYTLNDLDQYEQVGDFLKKIGYSFETESLERDFNKYRNEQLRSNKLLKKKFINRFNNDAYTREDFEQFEIMKFRQGGWKRIYRNKNTKTISEYTKDHDAHERFITKRKKK